MGGKPTAVLLATTVTFLAAGCGAHRSTTLTQDWAADAGDRVVLVDGGERVFTGEGKAVRVKDGATGQVVWSEREQRSLGRALLSSGTLAIGGASIRPDDHAADEYSTVVLETDRTVLIMDFTMTTDRIRAFDLDSGDELWESTDFAFTLARYGAAAELLRGAGGVLGRSAARGVESQVSEETPFYLEDLVLPVTGQNGFLFKTRDGLAMVDSRTGQQRWIADGIDGLGLAAVLEVSGGDELVVANFAPGNRMSRQLARIAMADGQVRWITEYQSPSMIPSVNRSLDLLLEGDRVVLVGHGVEVFDYDDGRAVWRTHEPTRGDNRMGGVWGRLVAAPVIHDGALYLADNTARDGFYCNRNCNSTISRYDLATGERLWETEAFPDIPAIRDLRIIGQTLVAAPSAEHRMIVQSRVVGLDPATGATRWSSPEARGTLAHVLVDGDHVIALIGSDLYRLDARTGDVVASASFEEAGIGAPFRRLTDGGDRVVVPSDWGVAAWSKGDLRQLYALSFRPQDQPDWDSLGFFGRTRVLMSPAKDDGVSGTIVEGDRILLLRRGGGVTVVDMNTGRVVGDLVVSFGRGDRRSGPIGRTGLQVSDDARFLYVYADGQVARYRLDN